MTVIGIMEEKVTGSVNTAKVRSLYHLYNAMVQEVLSDLLAQCKEA